MKFLKQSLLTLFFASNALIGFGQVIDHWETVIYNTDQWNYFIGTSEPNSNWVNTGFSASGWSKGSGGFGYDDDDDNNDDCHHDDNNDDCDHNDGFNSRIDQ